ncbi:MAG: TonB-dependent receptor plug domain-containing protein, partial [Gemmatimonadales bacterium]
MSHTKTIGTVSMALAITATLLGAQQAGTPERRIAADSQSISLRADSVRRAQRLATVTVSASPRLNETTERALEKQRTADNILTVLSGDVIRALPNANAAEAAARIPGISTERDEGEGKFVQIRGTEPRLSNVTINGVHVPGTQSGSRVAKLDDVPTDILAAIE